MGKVALFTVIGLTVVMGRMLVGSNEKAILLTKNVYERHEELISRFIAISGANIALSNLFDDPQWRAGITNISFNGGDLNVAIANVDSVVEITSTGAYSDAQKIIQIRATALPALEDLAIYTTGDVTNVTTLDEFGTSDPSLMATNLNSLPYIDHQALFDLANVQGYVESGDFSPPDGYPNGSFYYSDTTANITHVIGDLTVNGNRTIYGIFVVEGDIVLKGGSRVEGVLYLENSTGTIIYGGGDPYESSVTGGIISNGDVDGTGNHITVRYDPIYMTNFTHYGATDKGKKVSVLSWKEGVNLADFD